MFLYFSTSLIVLFIFLCLDMLDIALFLSLFFFIGTVCFVLEHAERNKKTHDWSN